MQGRETTIGAWTTLPRSRRAQETLTFIQKSDAPAPATHEETAAALVLTLHSWTRGHTIVLHDKTPPPTCAPQRADRLARPRGKPTWNGHPNEKMTSTPWCTPTATGAGQPRKRSPCPNQPGPHQRDRPPDTVPCTNSWPMHPTWDEVVPDRDIETLAPRS